MSTCCRAAGAAALGSSAACSWTTGAGSFLQLASNVNANAASRRHGGRGRAGSNDENIAGDLAATLVSGVPPKPGIVGLLARGGSRNVEINAVAESCPSAQKRVIVGTWD